MAETTTTESRFDPRAHFMNLKGKQYLPVNARVAWFREDCPIFEGWGIQTKLLAGSLGEKFATYRASITDPQGRIVAMGTKTEDLAGFGDFMEKAETGAIGRALACAGFGTLFAQDFGGEGEARIVDAPIAPVSRQGRDYASVGTKAAVVCTVCNDATKPVPAGRVTFCANKQVPVTHIECAKG